MADTSTTFDHVIVGAGVAAAAAVKGIRAVDDSATIAVLGAEADPPLYRPDLSKTLWLKDDATLAKSELGLADADFRPDTVVSALDPDAHTVTLADGTAITYGRVLLATGADPRTATPGPGDRVVYYRRAADFRRLHALAVPGSHVLVVGGGYIGAEMASALRQNDVEVTMVLGSEFVQEAMFPRDLARAVTEDFVARGVRLVHGRLADGAVDGETVTIRLEDGTELSGDAAVIGLGVTPNTALAEAAGLAIDPDDGGIVVDDHLRTSAPDVYAAGDAVSYPDALLGRRRVEHVDNAESMGEVAGRDMAGADDAYTHTPFFWSDLFEHGYEAIGDLSSRHETVEDFADGGFDTGVVYYLDGTRVVGVLLWNVWDSVGKAEALIRDSATEPVTDPASLKGRIPLG